jgi:hypothetical protein
MNAGIPGIAFSASRSAADADGVHVHIHIHVHIHVHVHFHFHCCCHNRSHINGIVLDASAGRRSDYDCGRTDEQ